jgi:hypothetical protein
VAESVPRVGRLIEGEAFRDAIHVAVAPLEAAEPLSPGQHFRLTDDRRAVGAEPYSDGAVGIVDPYLVARVEPGDRFYGFLYPGTVTSLRHAWTHPAFRVQIPGASRTKKEEE